LEYHALHGIPKYLLHNKWLYIFDKMLSLRPNRKSNYCRLVFCLSKNLLFYFIFYYFTKHAVSNIIKVNCLKNNCSSICLSLLNNIYKNHLFEIGLICSWSNRYPMAKPGDNGLRLWGISKSSFLPFHNPNSCYYSYYYKAKQNSISCIFSHKYLNIFKQWKKN
jgi:hypothetical protein